MSKSPIDISSDNTPIKKKDGCCGNGSCGKGQCACENERKAKEKGCCDTKESCCSTDSCCTPKCCGLTPECKKTIGAIIVAIILALGLAYAGCAIGHGVRSFSDAQRVVVVRGLAEQNVKADLAIWNIGFVATGNDLAAVQAKVESDSNTIRAYLKQNGLTDEEMIELPTSMTDLLSRDYRPEGAAQNRYIVNAGLRVRTPSVDKIKELSGLKIGALIKAGVSLREGQPPVYLFTGLKDIKPKMVAEATQDARKAAEQFAADSGAKLGGMKTAQQGVFQFLPRDQADGVMESYEIEKTARVVTSVTYFLAK